MKNLLQSLQNLYSFCCPVSSSHFLPAPRLAFAVLLTSFILFFVPFVVLRSSYIGHILHVNVWVHFSFCKTCQSQLCLATTKMDLNPNSKMTSGMVLYIWLVLLNFYLSYFCLPRVKSVDDNLFLVGHELPGLENYCFIHDGY